MATDTDDLHDEPENPTVSLLRQISREMVAKQKQHWGKGPTNVKSYILDDLVLVVMRGGLTVAERTMVDFGQQDLVRQFRQAFESQIATELRAMMEQLMRREVLAAQVQIMFDPNVMIQMFVLDHSPGALERFAAAELVLDDD